jgi:hypothetical protein
MISKESIRSPNAIFILYMLSAVVAIMIFRFILPGPETPLPVFERSWRMVQGILDIFDLFPALAFSALVIPFGSAEFKEHHSSFSKGFFKHILTSVITAIVAAIIYCCIFFFVQPMVKDYEENLRFKGEIYQLAKNEILKRDPANPNKMEVNWYEISQFIAICDAIWPNNPALNSYRIDAAIYLDEQHFDDELEKSHARIEYLGEHRSIAASTSLSGKDEPDAVQAIELSEIALKERKYYDAHWLAVLAQTISKDGSVEQRKAKALAGEAWNGISSLAPSVREEHHYDLYRMKQQGYQAMTGGKWIEAYYIFQELLDKTPDDPDVKQFLAKCETGAKETAFFLDEMQLSLGEILNGAIFSLPRENGRAVMRFSSLSTSNDYAYGMKLEFMNFDDNSKLTENITAEYAKIIPFKVPVKNTGNEIPGEEEKVLVLVHALNRHNRNIDYNGTWLFGRKSEKGILLDINFEEFLLLSQIRRGLPNLEINDIFKAAKIADTAGYVPQIFEAEILNRLGSAIFFLPMAIFVIVIGWRFRAKIHPRYLFIPLFFILPIVFHVIVFLYRSLLNILGIWLVLNLGFSTAFIVCIAVLVLTLLLSLIILAAQHS